MISSARRPQRLVPALALLFSGFAPIGSPVHALEVPLGEPAPPFRLPALDGGTIDSTELAGRYVVVHFATTWCPFCNAEAPHLERLWQDYRERGVEVLVIDVAEDPELVRSWREHWQLTLPVALDANGQIAAAYAPPSVLPDLPRDQVVIAANLLLDRAGRIRFYSLLDTRAFDARLVELTARLDALLAAEGGD